ncbi:MAG: response regulator [bacterium]
MRKNMVEILLVEDNPDDVELTLYNLKEHNIINPVHVARDGAEALEYIYGSDPASVEDLPKLPRLILLDLKLPRVNGLEVLKRLKTDIRTRMVPVIVLTYSKEERDIVESYKLGVNSYIVKPVDFDQFSSAIRNIGFYWLLLNQPPPLK